MPNQTFHLHVKREELWPHYRLSNHYPGLRCPLPTIEVGRDWYAQYREAEQRYFAFQAQIARALAREAVHGELPPASLKGDPRDEANH